MPVFIKSSVSGIFIILNIHVEHFIITLMKRILAALGLLIISFYLITTGLKHEDHIETEFNANLLCLSCIGIE